MHHAMLCRHSTVCVTLPALVSYLFTQNVKYMGIVVGGQNKGMWLEGNNSPNLTALLTEGEHCTWQLGRKRFQGTGAPVLLRKSCDCSLWSTPFHNRSAAGYLPNPVARSERGMAPHRLSWSWVGKRDGLWYNHTDLQMALAFQRAWATGPTRQWLHLPYRSGSLKI